MSSLQRLSLYGCHRLRSLPGNLRGMFSLHFLGLDGCLLLIGKLPAELKVLEDRGCVIERPADPPPASSAEKVGHSL